MLITWPVVRVGAVAAPLKFSEFKLTVASVEPIDKSCTFHLEAGGAAGKVYTQADEQFITTVKVLSRMVERYEAVCKLTPPNAGGIRSA